uniref:Transmembrane protein 181 n=2 Tax=Cacopsylla melanoneura TaxID=428564 RepID=A0A8D8PY66_9HEMI
MEGVTFGYAYHMPSGGCMMRIRNVLSQFSDVFSEFNRYLAPAYHHDRCERSVPMRLYSMHKRELVMVFLAFFACLGLVIFIGLTGPPITSTVSELGTDLLHKQNISLDAITTGPFVLQSPPVTPYSQQMWLIMTLKTEDTDDESYDVGFHYRVSITGVKQDHQDIGILNAYHHNRSRHLVCTRDACQEVMLLHLASLQYARYLVTVRLYNLDGFQKRYHINQITFHFKHYNPAFTQIEIWFRFIFLLGTAVITFWFTHTLRRYTIQDWSFEQKWMSILLPMLFLHDNPTFPMIFLYNSWMPGMLDVLFQTTFLSTLLLFWLCMYHGLRQNERKLLIFYVPKVLLTVGPLWFMAMVLGTWQHLTQVEDPTFSYKVDTEDYHILKVSCSFFLVVYLTYLVYLILRAYTDLRSMPFFDARLKFLTLLMCIVLGLSSSLFLVNYGIGSLEQVFISQLNTTYTSSAPFMTCYGLLNFYLYTMAYVYSPTQKNVFDNSITKDNPAFSMINDSDEEVVFGSDEESRRPLNRSNNDDDSD